MTQIAVQINNLTKNYGTVQALKGVSFSVEVGELFGLIGPDGAGKSSLFRILTSLLLADGGNATIMGHDAATEYRTIRNMIGYMPGRFSLYQDLSVEENLEFFATVFGTTIEENYDLIRDIYVQIEPFRKRLARKLSGGMKQKLALSCALIHKPEVLILDEPTTGVDAVSRKEFWDMLKLLKEKGITILVSTPYMDEASLCDRVALIQNGSIMDIDSPKNIVQKFSHTLLGIRTNNIYQLLNDLRTYPATRSVFPFGQYVHYTDNAQPDIQALQTYLADKKHTNIEINTIQPNIEDCFMDLMQNN